MERAALTLVFRVVFILFCESAGHLPMGSRTTGRSRSPRWCARRMTAGRACRRPRRRSGTASCLVPPGVYLTNKAPYLAFPGGTERDQAACLSIMNSLPFDWQARRFVEINVNYFILEGLRLPALSDADYNAIATAAARLSAVDERFADFAAATGVECGPLPEAERQRIRDDIDARVARAWGLTPEDLHVIFEDFTPDSVPPGVPVGAGGTAGGAGVRGVVTAR